MTGNLNTLALTYRPREFNEVVGHTLSVRALQGMVETEELPSGLLFSGASGSGKTTLARIVASKLDADVVEVDAASHGGVAETRKLMDTLRYASGRKYKILILDEAHSLSRDAFNALLKTLEEPPQGVMFILVTTDPSKLPKTVRTRLIEFTFNPLTPTEIVSRMIQVVKDSGIRVDVGIIKYIALHSEGSVRKALTDLGLCASAGISDVASYLKLVGDGDASLEILNHMERQDLTGMYSELEKALSQVSSPSVVLGQLIGSLRDLMVIRSGDPGTLITSDLEEKKILARILVPEKIFAMLRILWDLKTQVRSRGDSRQDLELAVALLYDVMNAGRSAVARKETIDKQHEPEEEVELTLEELENLGA